MCLGLGLDTGGTYTDAVVMDLDDGRILSKSKSMTTYEDLCIGIEGAIDLLDQSLLGSIGVVALSSTLATNSIVEGKGCRVGLICIGRDYDRTLSADYYTVIKGGNDVHGDPMEELGIDEAEAFMRSIAGKVQGIAISGYLSVRNPDQEQTIKALAKRILDVPVVCGHELSSELGFNERTTTCIMNSRLIPVMDDLIRSVRKALDERSIHAPLMISRGDGSMMKDTVARERPVETILSGPAASLMGAMHLTGVDDAIVMDMGGTTTDIGILRNGHPGLDEEGAIIDGKRTRVMAARIYTSGIGGDSRIVVNPRTVILTPQRVVPLCVAAVKWHSVAAALDAVRKKRAPAISRNLSRPEAQILDTEFYNAVKRSAPGYELSEIDSRFIDLVFDRPLTLTMAALELGCETFQINVHRMEDLGLVQRIGLTPTDILHADGIYTEFDVEASKIGAGYMANLAGLPYDTFIMEAKRAIRNKLCKELMKALISEDMGEMDLGSTGRAILMKAIDGSSHKDFRCAITLGRPIIGIGAPSGVYMRWVGEALGSEVYISDDSDVGNAIGAVCSSVSESIKFVIRPLLPMREDAKYEVFSKLGREWFMSMEEAEEACETKGRKHVTEAAIANNADVVEVSVEKIRTAFGAVCGEMLDEMTMIVSAAGKPRIL